MDGGSISTSRRLEKKIRANKKTFLMFYHWNRSKLCQKSYLNIVTAGLFEPYRYVCQMQIVPNIIWSYGNASWQM
jgi:hypothetical protein